MSCHGNPKGAAETLSRPCKAARKGPQLLAANICVRDENHNMLAGKPSFQYSEFGRHPKVDS
eukprot:5773544-Amphidinium_carterae.1